MYKNNYVTAIILAAGIGKRMNLDIPKQYILLSNETILKRTIRNVLKSEYIDECILVVRKEDIKKAKEVIKDITRNNIRNNDFKIKYVIGGKERQDSAYSGINAVSDNTDIILVHDGVRPFIKKEIIEDAIKSVEITGSVATAVMVKDTIKCIKEGGKIVESTPRRENLRAIQTPQVFKKDILKKAYDTAYNEKYYSTDDASLVEYAGGDVYLIEGDYSNIKITTKEDLIIANAIIEEENGEY